MNLYTCPRSFFFFRNSKAPWSLCHLPVVKFLYPTGGGEGRNTAFGRRKPRNCRINAEEKRNTGGNCSTGCISLVRFDGNGDRHFDTLPPSSPSKCHLQRNETTRQEIRSNFPLTDCVSSIETENGLCNSSTRP